MITLPLASCFGLQFGWGGDSCLATLAFLQDLMCACCLQTAQGEKAGSASVAQPIALPGTSDGDRASVKAIFRAGKVPNSPRKGQHGGNKGEHRCG